MTKSLALYIGILIGLALPFAIDYVLFDDPTPTQPSKIYEDGSYVGCLPEAQCND